MLRAISLVALIRRPIIATYAVWLLALHPEEEVALIKELAGLPGHFNNEDLKGVQRLDHIISETLRLCGAIQQGLPRSVPPEGAEFGGFHIPAGTTVEVPAYTMHRDPTVWPKPNAFKPLRWREPTREMRDSFYACGGGSRGSCPHLSCLNGVRDQALTSCSLSRDALRAIGASPRPRNFLPDIQKRRPACGRRWFLRVRYGAGVFFRLSASRQSMPCRTSKLRLILRRPLVAEVQPD